MKFSHIFASAILFSGSVLFSQDGFEPNNSFSQATSISLGAELSATIHENGDEDFYVFEISESGVIVANISSVPAAVSMRMIFFDENQNQLTIIDRNPGQAGILDKEVNPGTYYLKLQDSGNNDSSVEPYIFRVTLDRTDTNEVNNSFSTAAPIQLDKIIQGTIRSLGDEDFYVFEISESGVIVANISSVPAAVSMRITFFDENQNQLTSIDRNPGQAGILDKEVNPGTYYLKLQDSGNNDSSIEPYVFRVTLDRTDTNEVNNSFSTATLITLGQNVQGNIRAIGDLDFYLLETANSDTVPLLVNPVPSNINLRVVIFDRNQSQLFQMTGNQGQAISFDLPLPAQDIIYIRVSAGNTASSSEPYNLLVGTPVTSVEENEDVDLPISFKLLQNYPNPFNPSTEIRYQLSAESQVTLEVYNMTGQKIRTLVKEKQTAGYYALLWNGTNDDFQEVASGVYFYKLSTNTFVKTRRMILLR